MLFRRSAVTLFAASFAASAALIPLKHPQLNVILVSIDTLRADHLGCYGYRRPTSPRIDEFSREAVLFENVIAAAPSTLPSHASMFTALIVPHHGASIKSGTALAPDQLTLAEILRDRGYATASWNGGGQVDAIWGLSQGFELYESAREYQDQTSQRGSHFAPTDHLAGAVSMALDWMDHRKDRRPFFIFLHSYEVHHPYTPSPEMRALFPRYRTRLSDNISIEDLRHFNDGDWPLTQGDLQQIIACYDAEIRSADAAFGQLVDGLRQRHLLDRTLLVLTSDHGEEFAEHGRVGWHSHTLFDELLRVPLIMRLPKGSHAGVRVPQQIRGIDVAPTILDALGIPSPAVFEGRSALDLAAGASSSEPQRLALSAKDGGGTLSLRGGGWKWIGPALYDLRADPGEKHNLRRQSKRYRARGRAMARWARAWCDTRPPAPGLAVQPSAEVAERLRTLGYVN